MVKPSQLLQYCTAIKIHDLEDNVATWGEMFAF